MFAETPNHFVVAFDRTFQDKNYQNTYKSEQTLRTLEKVLRENGYRPNEDYISMVGYTLNYTNPSIENFVEPVRANGKELLWQKLSGQSLVSLFPNGLSEGLQLLNGGYGSMQSMAKQYSIIETNTKSSHPTSGRTFLYMVTDEKVSGSDDNYSQEWSRASNNEVTNSAGSRPKFDALKNNVFRTVDNFNDNFRFKRLRNAEGQEIKVVLAGEYGIVPYELIYQDRATIHNITDLPVMLPFRRIKGGYQLQLEVNTLQPEYTIETIRIADESGTVLSESDTGDIYLFLPTQDYEVGDSIRLTMTLALHDGLYNGMVITPENPIYFKAMSVSQAISVPEEAKVLGIFPLSDAFWLWDRDDVVMAVMVWDLIILVALIITLFFLTMYFIKRLSAYRPRSKKIRLRPVGIKEEDEEY